MCKAWCLSKILVGFIQISLISLTDTKFAFFDPFFYNKYMIIFKYLNIKFYASYERHDYIFTMNRGQHHEISSCVIVDLCQNTSYYTLNILSIFIFLTNEFQTYVMHFFLASVSDYSYHIEMKELVDLLHHMNIGTRLGA